MRPTGQGPNNSQKPRNSSKKSSIGISSTTISAKQHKNKKIETKLMTYIFSFKYMNFEINS